MGGMRWNPFVAAGILALIALLIGAIVVHERATATAAGVGGTLSAWSGGGVVPSIPAATPLSSAPAPAPAQNSYTVPAVGTEAATTTLAISSIPATPESNDDRIAYLLSLLSKPEAATNSSASGSAASQGSLDAWSYIPSNMISTSSPSGTPMTPEQKALHEYGNAAGSYLQAYDNAHQSQVEILTDSINDRHNASKAAAVAQVGADLAAVGTQLDSIQNIPPIAQAANTQLAQAYERAGQALIAVSQATGGDDTGFVDAIKAYDAVADSFNIQFATLSTLFSSNGVTFSPTDPGSVFVFTQNGF